MTIDIYSVISLLIVLYSGSTPIGNATGFLWKDSSTSQHYLVTNYHVLSGKKPTTDEIIDSKGRTPTTVKIFHNATKLGEWKPHSYPLMNKKNTPKWLEHPKYGRKVDVVLLSVDLPPGTIGYPINDQKWIDLQLRPAETVSIVGFPRGESAGGRLAIWQTGYIASEPEFDYSNLPALLVDSRAWPGNSGSPVIARRYGSWSLKDGSQSFGAGKSFVTDFIGVLSRSIGKSEMKFVWKRSVIEEILQ